MAGYIISVDIGTQGTKAAVFDTQMNCLDTEFEASNLISPCAGTTWQDPQEIFNSVVSTIANLMIKLANIILPSEILAIGIDSQMAGIMGIDKHGEAVTYYDSWLDTRCYKYVEQMKSKANKKIIEITGGPVTYTHGPKILWWKNEHKDEYDKICKFVLPHGYVVGKMVGLAGEDAYFDYTCLQYSGFGDNKYLEWSRELLDMFEIDIDKMARIVSPFDIIGMLTKQFADMTNLVEGIPVVAGAGDTSASILGSGLFDSGTLLDCAGTASVMCSVVDKFIPDTKFETMTMMRSPIDGYWFPLAYINGGGLCLRWFRDNFTGTPSVLYEQLESVAKDIEAGSEGVIFVPHFAGRVLPSDASMRGSFVGLDWKHTKEHLFRAVMEGISYEYAYYIDVLSKLYPNETFENIYAVGGGAKSELFLSIKADVLGKTVLSFETGDTALIGTAVIAAVGVGAVKEYKPLIKNAMKLRKTYRSDSIKNVEYKKNIDSYLGLLNALTEVYNSGVYQKR